MSIIFLFAYYVKTNKEIVFEYEFIAKSDSIIVDNKIHIFRKLDKNIINKYNYIGYYQNSFDINEIIKLKQFLENANIESVDNCILPSISVSKIGELKKEWLTFVYYYKKYTVLKSQNNNISIIIDLLVNSITELNNEFKAFERKYILIKPNHLIFNNGKKTSPEIKFFVKITLANSFFEYYKSKKLISFILDFEIIDINVLKIEKSSDFFTIKVELNNNEMTIINNINARLLIKDIRLYQKYLNI